MISLAGKFEIYLFFVIVKLKANDIVVWVITVYDSSYEEKKEFIYKDTP
jgi:hypothetical protein